MAQLKDLIVNGASRLIGDVFTNKIQVTSLQIPTASDGITYGTGSNGQVLKTNGTNVYWASLGGASGYGVTDSTSASAIGTSTSLPTERDIYYGLPTINNAHNYTSSTTIYAPTAGGTADTQALVGNGATTAPKWVNISPSISITAGDGSNAPKINVTVLGRSGTAQAITTASTSVYGVTKLYNGVDSTSTALAATANAVKTAYDRANAIVAAADAMVFKGTLAGASSTTYTPAADRGWTYKVSTAGLINGERVEVGDILICTTDSTAAATSSNVSTVKANWVIIQNNVDGAIFKSTNSFTSGAIILADGTEGKVKTGSIASHSYTPAGTVSQPTFTGSSLTSTGTYTPAGTNAKSAVTIKPTTTNVYSMTSAGSVTAGVAASLTMKVENEVLSFTWTANTPTAVTLPGRSNVIAAWTGYTTGVDNTYAAAQTFTGASGSVSVSGTPAGTVSKPTFSGTAATLSHTVS